MYTPMSDHSSAAIAPSAMAKYSEAGILGVYDSRVCVTPSGTSCSACRILSIATSSEREQGAMAIPARVEEAARRPGRDELRTRDQRVGPTCPLVRRGRADRL